MVMKPFLLISKYTSLFWILSIIRKVAYDNLNYKVYTKDIKMQKGQRGILVSILHVFWQCCMHKKEMYNCVINFYTFLRKKSHYVAVSLVEYCNK